MSPLQHPGLADPRLSDTILQAVGALVVVLDREARIIRFNDACEEATGWTREEVLGRPVFDVLVTAEERAGVVDMFARLSAGDFPLRHENQWIRKDGSRLTIAWSNTCTVDAAGEVVLVVGTGTDLTRERVAEAAFGAIVAHTPNVAIQIYERDGTIVTWNPASAALYGWTTAETVGRSARDTCLRAAGFDERIAAIAAVERAGTPVGPAPFSLRHKDGRELIALSTVFQIPGPGRARFVCMDIDITSQVRVQGALRVAAGSIATDGLFVELTRQLAETAGWRWGIAVELEPDGVTAHTRAFVGDGEVLEPLRYPLAGTPCEVVVGGGRLAHVHDAAAQFPAVGILRTMGVEAYVGTVVVGSNGRRLGVLGLLHDQPAEATSEVRSLMELFAARLGAELEREHAEHAIRALNAELERRVALRTADLDATNAELSAFSYTVSHDLRAPVRAITGFAAALEEDHGERLAPEGRDLLLRIRQAGGRMAQLIDDLLALSRISRQPIAAVSVDLSELCADVVRDLVVATPGRAVRVDIAPGLVVRADPGLLRVMFTNLLGNAWKFTQRQAAPVIEVFGEERDGLAWLCVRDNGVGFDEAYAGRLFGAFQRLHHPSEFEGTGIGLATVARIVRRHGGKVAARGAVNSGATIAVHLPG